MLRFYRLFVGFLSLLFTGLGLWLMLDPLAVMDLYPMTLDAPMAVSEIRAVFGGLMMGTGLACLWLSVLRGQAYEAGGVMIVIFGALLLARIVGFANEGMPSGVVLNETIFELVSFVILVLSSIAIRPGKT